MNFTLRPLSINDLESLMKYADNPKIANNLTNVFPSPYTEESGRWFIDFASSHDPIRIMAIDVAGEFVGAIGIHPKDDIMVKNAELGYWLGEAFWGKGIMTKAILQMVDYGFKTFDINRIYAIPFGSNIGSQKALEKAGFKLEGRFEQTIFKNGRYEDELIYAVRL